MSGTHTVFGAHVRFGVASDVGRVRKVNEDSFLTEPPVFAVADGMGGHAGGDIASQIAVHELAALAGEYDDRAAAQDAVVAALQAAQARIHGFAMERRGAGAERWYSGTTVVAALLIRLGREVHWLLANLGDSRIYRVRRGVLDQVSTDHSVVQELIDAGKLTPGRAATHPDRHVITRALGGPTLAPPDFFLMPVSETDRLVLVSDGVSGELSDEAMQSLLAEHDDPGVAADRLVAAAVAAGGQDNATAVVVDVTGTAP